MSTELCRCLNFLFVRLPPLFAGSIAFSGFPFVHASTRMPESLWTWYFITYLGEFHQIYNFGALGYK